MQTKDPMSSSCEFLPLPVTTPSMIKTAVHTVDKHVRLKPHKTNEASHSWSFTQLGLSTYSDTCSYWKSANPNLIISRHNWTCKLSTTFFLRRVRHAKRNIFLTTPMTSFLIHSACDMFWISELKKSFPDYWLVDSQSWEADFYGTAYKNATYTRLRMSGNASAPTGTKGNSKNHTTDPLRHVIYTINTFVCGRDWWGSF